MVLPLLIALSRSSNLSGLSCLRITSVNPLLICMLSCVRVEFMWLRLKNILGVLEFS